jgi:transcriptional regulator with XRE-family HTH domain
MYVELHGEKVREIRETTELGAEDFAKEAGISRGTLGRAERGLPIQLSTARAIGAALGVDAKAIGRNPRPRIT